MSIITLKPIKNKNSHLPDTLLEDHVYRLGSQFRNGAPLVPFTDAENKWLYDYFGKDEKEPKDKQWLREFWSNFTLKIDVGGKILNIGKTELGEPINLLDYCAYCFAKKHSEVAENEQSIGSGHRFYLIDPEYQKNKDFLKTEFVSKAMLHFAELSKEKIKIKQVYTVLGGSRSEFEDEKSIVNYVFNQAMNEPQKFIKVCEDKTLELRFKITSYVEFNILRKVSTSYFRFDDNLADTEEEMIAYLANKKNAGFISQWDLELKEKQQVKVFN